MFCRLDNDAGTEVGEFEPFANVFEEGDQQIRGEEKVEIMVCTIEWNEGDVGVADVVQEGNRLAVGAVVEVSTVSCRV